MPTKTAKAPRRSPRKKEEPLEIVVRRGAVRRFDALKTRTAEMPVVVTWDRRTTDRRTPEARQREMDVPRDRRASDRRQAPPFTWDVADFVVVPPASERKAAGKRKAKKVHGR